MKEESRIAVIVVTYNRERMLKRCMEALFQQTVPLCKICVIDNASTDETEKMMQVFQRDYPGKIEYIRLDENTGGAGGFYSGFQWADEYKDWDWLMVMDDDAAPEPEYTEKLLSKSKEYPEVKSFIGTEYVGYTDQIAYGGRRIIDKERTVRTKIVSAETYKNPCFYVDTAVFVGLMMHRSVVKQAGYPDASFFIYYDDTDYCFRLRPYTKILHITDAKIFHRENYEKDVVMEGQKTWRLFYLYRNELVIKKRYIKHWVIRYGWIVKNYLLKVFEILHYKTQKRKNIWIISRATWDVLNNKLGRAKYIDEK